MSATIHHDIDAYWDDQATDEAEDFVLRASTDAHGWVRLNIDERVLCLRPSDLVALVAGSLA